MYICIYVYMYICIYVYIHVLVVSNTRSFLKWIMIPFGPRLSRLQTCMRTPATVPPGAGLPQPLFRCTEGVPMATRRRLSVRLLMA